LLDVPFFSTLMGTRSIGFMSSSLEVSYVRQASHSYGIDIGPTILSSTTTTTLLNIVDTSTPIFHFDEEVRESLTSLGYP